MDEIDWQSAMADLDKWLDDVRRVHEVERRLAELRSELQAHQQAAGQARQAVAGRPWANCSQPELAELLANAAEVNRQAADLGGASGLEQRAAQAAADVILEQERAVLLDLLLSKAEALRQAETRLAELSVGVRVWLDYIALEAEEQGLSPDDAELLVLDDRKRELLQQVESERRHQEDLVAARRATLAGVEQCLRIPTGGGAAAGTQEPDLRAFLASASMVIVGMRERSLQNEDEAAEFVTEAEQLRRSSEALTLERDVLQQKLAHTEFVLNDPESQSGWVQELTRAGAFAESLQAAADLRQILESQKRRLAAASDLKAILDADDAVRAARHRCDPQPNGERA